MLSHLNEIEAELFLRIPPPTSCGSRTCSERKPGDRLRVSRSYRRSSSDLGLCRTGRRRPRGACHNLRPVTIGGVTSERLQNQKEFFG